jgi:hypothetical protein
MVRKGRPSLDASDPSVQLSLRLPGKIYDSLWKRAQAEDVSVPELIRRDLGRQGRFDAAAAPKLPK